MSGLTTNDFIAALNRMVVVFEEEMDALSRLDAVIGDGDHGISMARGFRTVAERLPGMEARDIGTVSAMVGASLTGSIGGVTGPVFGTMFAQLGTWSQGKDDLNVADLARGFRAALDAIKALGRAEVGDKTMVDALAPAVEALEHAAEEGLDMSAALDRASRAAEGGARATADMRATKGRARYLGERSIGHQDPGATSLALIMRALAEGYAAGHDR